MNTMLATSVDLNGATLCIVSQNDGKVAVTLNLVDGTAVRVDFDSYELECDPKDRYPKIKGIRQKGNRYEFVLPRPNKLIVVSNNAPAFQPVQPFGF